MSAENITAKALKCIDEIYPSADTLNDTYFPVEEFLEEAVRWVIDIVPSHELTEREELVLTNASVSTNGEGSGTLPEEFGRLVYFKAEDWKRPVFGVITVDDPRYIQQFNKVLRGNPSRPIVVLSMDCGNKISRTLKWFTTKEVTYEAQHVPYSVDYIPMMLEDLTSWKLAEIVLMSMSDTQNAAVCTARVNELLQQIAV